MTSDDYKKEEEKEDLIKDYDSYIISNVIDIYTDIHESFVKVRQELPYYTIRPPVKKSKKDPEVINTPPERSEI